MIKIARIGTLSLFVIGEESGVVISRIEELQIAGEWSGEGVAKVVANENDIPEIQLQNKVVVFLGYFRHGCKRTTIEGIISKGTCSMFVVVVVVVGWVWNTTYIR